MRAALRRPEVAQSPTPGRIFTASRPPEPLGDIGSAGREEDPLFAGRYAPPSDADPHHDDARGAADEDHDDEPADDEPVDDPIIAEASIDEAPVDDEHVDEEQVADVLTTDEPIRDELPHDELPHDELPHDELPHDGLPQDDHADDGSLVLPEWQVPWNLDDDVEGLAAELELLLAEQYADDRATEPAHDTRLAAAVAEPAAAPQLVRSSQPARPAPQLVRTPEPVDAAAPPQPPATRVHVARIDSRPGPIRMTPSEALALVREGRDGLRRGPAAH